MLVGLGSAVYTGYRGYQATAEGGRFAELSGGGAGSGERVSLRDLLTALRDERRLTGEVLGDPRSSTAALQAQWARTDAAAAALSRSSAQPVVTPAQLSTLVTLRPAVAARSVSLTDAVERYSTLIVDAADRASTQLAQTVADPRVVREDEINKQLTDLSEALDVAGALSFAAFSDAGMSNDAFRVFVREMGRFQSLLRTLQPSLPAEEAAQLNLLTTGPDGEIVAVVHRSILHGSVLRAAGTGGPVPGRPQDADAPGPDVRIEDARVVAPLPMPRADWQASTARLSTGLAALQDRHLTYSAQIAREVGRQQLITALVGSLALLVFAIAVLVVSLAVSRTLIGRLQRLREQTIELSQDRLPAIVQRLRQGQQVDVDTELPALDYGSDEIGQVADAFSEAQRTAVTAAAGEAKTRAGLRTVFLDIAHRNQAIVYRQLKVLDRAERAEEDADQLALLFQLDHLATRARRNAENLIILGGGQAGRQWRNPVSLLQVIRSAISEAEDYTRVAVAAVPKISVPGAAVADLIHLLAELVDNATRFSPPTGRVEVRGNLVGRGLVIELEDQGLGMDPEEIERFNRTLHDPPDFEVMALAEEPRLGMFVVARLAARHGIRVTLTPSPAYGGTKVVVLVPAALLQEDQAPLALTGSVALPPTKTAPRALPAQPPGPERPADERPADEQQPLEQPAEARGEQQAPQEQNPMLDRAERLIALLTDPSLPSPGQEDARPQLPRRNRQTHLSPKLRSEAATAGPEAAEPEAVDAESARSRMSALQRGTMRGRAADVEHP